MEILMERPVHQPCKDSLCSCYLGSTWRLFMKFKAALFPFCLLPVALEPRTALDNLCDNLSGSPGQDYPSLWWTASLLQCCCAASSLHPCATSGLSAFSLFTWGLLKYLILTHNESWMTERQSRSVRANAAACFHAQTKSGCQLARYLCSLQRRRATGLNANLPIWAD